MLLILTMKQLDDIDKKIFSALKSDAYVSSSKMSKQLDIGASTIRRRINKLIEHRIMRIQAVQLNHVRTSLTVCILLKVETNAILRTADILAGEKEVGFISLAAGYYNIVCMGWFESVESYSRFLNTTLYPMRGVLDIDTLIGTEYLKHASIRLYDAVDSIERNSERLDEIDMKIIEELEKDGRQSTSNLAKKLNISTPTIKRRLKILLNNNIIRILAIPNLRTGKTIVVSVALKVENNVLNQISDQLCEIDEVRQVLLLSGTYDISAWAWFESIGAFSKFLKNVINPLHGVEKKLIVIHTEFKKWPQML